MKLDEIFQPFLNEYGRRGFPGFGRGIFGRQHFEYIAEKLGHIDDAIVRDDLAEWFSSAFSRDGNFYPDRFAKFVEDGKRARNDYPTFQQRHFYYFAGLIKGEDDRERALFIANWLGTLFDRLNGAFKEGLWMKECGFEDVKLSESLLDEGPAYGYRGFGGWGQKFLGRKEICALADTIHSDAHPSVKEHITEWFVELCTKDNPHINQKLIKKACLEGETLSCSPPRFQMRHFYLIAEGIKIQQESEFRAYLCHLFIDLFLHNNEYFQPARWEDYCDIPSTHRKYEPENWKKNGRDRSIPVTR